MKSLFGINLVVYVLEGNQILRARIVQRKIKETNFKMLKCNMSYRIRLGAILASDNRPGHIWND